MALSLLMRFVLNILTPCIACTPCADWRQRNNEAGLNGPTPVLMQLVPLEAPMELANFHPPEERRSFRRDAKRWDAVCGGATRRSWNFERQFRLRVKWRNCSAPKHRLLCPRSGHQGYGIRGWPSPELSLGEIDLRYALQH
jgi:hypothetical protein